MRRWWSSVCLASLMGIGLAVAAGVPDGESKSKAASNSAGLMPPVRLEVNGKPIDTDVGHAAPFVGDFNGDGKNDLLVGQFGSGVLWVYLNSGSNYQMKLADGFKFKEGKPEGTVPTG